ncbi:hypothetical protein BGZ60DRAFT_259249 [Tricladium varicosporioides]|nr:hypothetical protein BGZ60DRAFT_259249 [Hymenoscyphus varicosporioides]
MPSQNQLRVHHTVSSLHDGSECIPEAVNACKSGDIENLRSILGGSKEAGKSTDIKGGKTYLHHVIQCLNGSIALRFLDCLVGEFSADINARCRLTGETPLHIAVKLRKVELAEMLILKGANVDLKSNGGKTPLGLAVANRVDTRLMESLIQKGATCDVEALNCRARKSKVYELMGQNGMSRISSSVSERPSRGPSILSRVSSWRSN